MNIIKLIQIQQSWCMCVCVCVCVCACCVCCVCMCGWAGVVHDVNVPILKLSLFILQNVAINPMWFMFSALNFILYVFLWCSGEGSHMPYSEYIQVPLCNSIWFM